jgi:ribonuclease R
MVPRRGLEPPPTYVDQHLKLARLPIPPPGHSTNLSVFQLIQSNRVQSVAIRLVAHCTQSHLNLSIRILIMNLLEIHHLPSTPKKTKSPAGKETPKAKKNKPYKHPIPSRNDILEMLTDVGKPIKADPIMTAYGLKGQRSRSLLVDQLQKMVRSGQLLENRRGEFCLTAKLDLVTGKVSGHRDGFGFVIRDDGIPDDVFLSAREMRALFDGDRVAIRIVGDDHRGRAQGELVDVLERGTREIAGQFIRERGIGIVIPDNAKLSHRILIPKGEAANAKHGNMVVAEILDYPTHVEQATGRITTIIGVPGDKGIATEIAIHAHAIPFKWPDAVKKEVQSFGTDVPDGAKQGRTELREVDLITIDGADARDFDDAVYCKKTDKGWRLLVAIADVANYVEIGSALDKEAIVRGTSVYFPDRVVPMLPEVLSNGLCSLNPKVDRLCMVCDMRVSSSGEVVRTTFFEGVMKSKARLTYSQVSDFLSGKSTSSVPNELQDSVRELHALYKAFASQRSRRGAIEIDLPQTRFKLNSDGEIERIEVVPRNDAHRLIEECMIAANVEAAKFLKEHKIPGLYRVHPKPDADRFDELRLYLVTLGLKVPHPDHVEPRHFTALIDQIKDRPDSAAITMAMLRSLTHAEYSPANVGHFGLALGSYAHFTSPIRRYPDLLVHRAIRHIVRGGKAGKYDYSPKDMERLGAITSAHEKRAEDATRDVEAWLKCQYMEGHVGEEFDGVITGVTNFGVFVQITELMTDGLVHVTSLANDYYKYDAGSQRLIGERSGLSYSLGAEMRVRVHKVDMETRKIDFRPVETTPQAGRKSRSSAPEKRRK